MSSTQKPNQNTYDDEGKPQSLVGGDSPPDASQPKNPGSQTEALNEKFSNPGGQTTRSHAGRGDSTGASADESKVDSKGFPQQDDSDDSSKSTSRSDLSSQEDAADSGAQSEVPGAEQSFVKAGSFAKKSAAPKGLRARLVGNFKKRAKRNVAGILIVSLLGGGGYAGFSIVQGPLEVMHLSQILQRPMAGQEQDSENRTKGLLRFARSGNIGETRLSALGSRSAAKTTEKLKAIGVNVTETTGAGRPTAYEIDTRKFDPGKPIDRALKDFLKDNPQVSSDNVSITRQGGRNGGIIEVRSPNGGALDDKTSRAVQKGVISKLVEGKRLGKLTTAIKARPVVRFTGTFSALHPWEKAKIRSIEAAKRFDEARRAKKGQRSAKAQARVERIQGKLKPAAGPAAVVSLAQLGICLAKDIAHETPLLTNENVVAPAEDTALQFISMGEQERSGQDFHITQPGAVVSTFKDKNGKSIWDSKALNALANADEGNGQEADPDIKTSFSSKSPEADVDRALNKVGGQAICSTTGQIIGGALGVAALIAAIPTGGASEAAVFAAFTAVGAAATVGAAAAAATFIPKLLADDPPIKNLAGPALGTIGAYGSEALGNNFYMKSGGAELGQNARTEIEKRTQLAERQDFESKSFVGRVFDVKDYRSLASRTIDTTDPDPVTNVSNIASGLVNMPSSASKVFATFTPKALAADTRGSYDFGFPKYGFSAEDINNPLMEDPYENAEKAATILSNDSYVKRARKCFGVDIQRDDSGKLAVNVAKNPEGDPELEVIPSTSDYIDANCAEGSDDWLRVRLFIFDSRTMEAYSCYDGDNDACVGVEGDDQATANAPTEGGGAISNGDILANKDKFTEILKLPAGAIGLDPFGFYHQCQDPRWATKEYPYASGGGNDICNSGCGPSSLAMVISNLSTTIINPYEVGQKIKQYHAPGGTSMSGAIHIVEQYGLTPHKVTGNYSAELKKTLSAGGLLILNANPASPFTRNGHFVVIRGISADGTKFYVGDPADDNGNGQNRNAQAWPVSSLPGWQNSDGIWAVEK